MLKLILRIIFQIIEKIVRFIKYIKNSLISLLENIKNIMLTFSFIVRMHIKELPIIYSKSINYLKVKAIWISEKLLNISNFLIIISVVILLIIIRFIKLITVIFSFDLYKDTNYIIFLQNRAILNLKKKNLEEITKNIEAKKYKYTEPLVDGNINQYINVSNSFLSLKIKKLWCITKSDLYYIILFYWKK
jgi:hypothetical protein